MILSINVITIYQSSNVPSNSKSYDLVYLSPKEILSTKKVTPMGKREFTVPQSTFL